MYPFIEVSLLVHFIEILDFSRHLENNLATEEVLFVLFLSLSPSPFPLRLCAGRGRFRTWARGGRGGVLGQNVHLTPGARGTASSSHSYGVSQRVSSFNSCATNLVGVERLLSHGSFFQHTVMRMPFLCMACLTSLLAARFCFPPAWVELRTSRGSKICKPINNSSLLRKLQVHKNTLHTTLHQNRDDAVTVI